MIITDKRRFKKWLRQANEDLPKDYLPSHGYTELLHAFESDLITIIVVKEEWSNHYVSYSMLTRDNTIEVPRFELGKLSSDFEIVEAEFKIYIKQF